MSIEFETLDLGRGFAAIAVVEVVKDIHRLGGSVFVGVEKKPIAIAIRTASGLRLWSNGLSEARLLQRIDEHLSQADAQD